MPRLDLTALKVIEVETMCGEGEPPPVQEREIIEIGLCPLDLSTLGMGAAGSLVVRPQRWSVSALRPRMTLLTQSEVEAGVPFRMACEILVHGCSSRGRAWAGYGDSDRSRFERQGQPVGVPHPFGRRCLGAKAWMAISLGLSREPGMTGALRLLRLPLEGMHRWGRDDARNIARIITRLLAGAGYADRKRGGGKS